MSKKHIRLSLSLAIIAATVGAFLLYAKNNPEILRQLGETSWTTLGLLLLLYVPWYLAIIWILSGSLDIYRRKISFRENFLVNAYSSVANFFGPGQTGPAVRGVYLKKRHGLKIRSYLFATLIYYTFFAVISAVFVSMGSRPWWQTVFLVSIVGGFSFLVIKRFQKRTKKDDQKPNFTTTNLGVIFLATLLQLVLQFIIYYIELSSVNPDVSWPQALTYTGIANFAMFVALTPGGIGIRESFLLFSGNLHHISNSDVVVASAIDRGIYLLMLGILAAIVFGLHAKDRLHLRQMRAE